MLACTSHKTSLTSKIKFAFAQAGVQFPNADDLQKGEGWSAVNIPKTIPRCAKAIAMIYGVSPRARGRVHQVRTRHVNATETGTFPRASSKTVR